MEKERKGDAMSNTHEINVNDSNFKEEVLSSELPVLVDFWAEWCGPCRMIAPVIGELAEEYSGKLKVCKLNVEEGAQTATTYGVMNIPTIMIFKGGNVVDKVIGSVPKSSLESKITAHL
ncbi:MAG: thioredoxin [Candidatus Omnitrophica bacterium]|nr:thioredoxin [Candidatus Omnitrophota bacterium]MDD5487611.1 thioredoxin [Candidatus Omnitrophota bacterium]